MNSSASIRIAAAIAVFGLVLPIQAGAILAQEIRAVPPPPDSPSGAPTFVLSGFPPNTDVSVSFFRTAPDGVAPAYGSSAIYRTNAHGSTEAGATPISGDWAGSYPEAPFWTMKEVPGAPLPPIGTVLLRATAGQFTSEATYDLTSLRTVKTEDVPEFPGAFLVRPVDLNTPLPLIIVLGGSEGNDGFSRSLAPLLANEGFAVLGLPYYSPDRGEGQLIPGLPALFSEIQVDRLEQVLTWAQSDLRVDAERIGLWGNSKGAEFALIAASNYPWIDAVTAIVPPDVVLEGFGTGQVERTGTSSFALNSRPLDFVPTGPVGRGKATKQTGRWANPFRAAAARIPIERFNGLLLVAGGANDPVLDSAGAAQAIAERRAEAGKPTISLIFHNAGHYIGGGLGLLAPIEAARGETPEGTGRARREIWAEAVKMFKAAWPR